MYYKPRVYKGVKGKDIGKNALLYLFNDQHFLLSGISSLLVGWM